MGIQPRLASSSELSAIRAATMRGTRWFESPTTRMPILMRVGSRSPRIGTSRSSEFKPKRSRVPGMVKSRYITRLARSSSASDADEFPEPRGMYSPASGFGRPGVGFLVTGDMPIATSLRGNTNSLYPRAIHVPDISTSGDRNDGVTEEGLHQD